MILKTIDFVKKIIIAQRTPEKIAQASAIGIFIGFSPFVGFHWLLTIILAWGLRLNIGIMYIASHVINNPFTMVPIYMADYATGNYIARFLGIDFLSYNPWWMDWLNLKLSCMGIPTIALWSFLIGGHVLGAFVACIAYPALVFFYKKIIRPTVLS